MTKTKYYWAAILFCMVSSSFLYSCRQDDDPLIPSIPTEVTPGDEGPIKGFFLLNEGNV